MLDRKFKKLLTKEKFLLLKEAHLFMLKYYLMELYSSYINIYRTEKQKQMRILKKK